MDNSTCMDKKATVRPPPKPEFVKEFFLFLSQRHYCYPWNTLILLLLYSKPQKPQAPLKTFNKDSHNDFDFRAIKIFANHCHFYYHQHFAKSLSKGFSNSDQRIGRFPKLLKRDDNFCINQSLRWIICAVSELNWDTRPYAFIWQRETAASLENSQKAGYKASVNWALNL